MRLGIRVKRSRHFRKSGVTLFLLICAIFAGQKCAAAAWFWQEQQQSQSGQQPPAQSSQSPTQPTPTGEQPVVKQKKVWTEDEVILLRTPADTYQVKKEAKEAADAKTAAQEAARRAQEKSGKQPATIKLPETIEDTEKKLKDTQQHIQAQSDQLDSLQAELLSAPDDQQAGKQKQIDQLIANMEALKLERKVLQDHLQKLQEKTKPETPAPATAPPPPPSPST